MIKAQLAQACDIGRINVAMSLVWVADLARSDVFWTASLHAPSVDGSIVNACFRPTKKPVNIGKYLGGRAAKAILKMA